MAARLRFLLQALEAQRPSPSLNLTHDLGFPVRLSLYGLGSVGNMIQLDVTLLL